MTGPTPEPLEIKGELKMSSVLARHPGVATFVVGAALAVGLLSSRPALAECVPDNFPNNWLQSQENIGGHTIANHVSKTNQWLVDRFNDNYQIDGSSSYDTIQTATQHIQAALAIAQDGYNAWEPNANNNNRRPITSNLGRTAGYGVFTPTERPADVGDIEDVNRLIVVLKKTGALVRCEHAVCRKLRSAAVPPA